MMHAISSKPSESSQIARLTLAKFSHTTTSINHSGPFSWTHIIGNGEIAAVFERLPILAPGATQTLLKVFQGYNLLVISLGRTLFGRQELMRSALLLCSGRN